MDWKLFNESGELISEVNCQYDSLDISEWVHDAIEVKVDFINKSTYIIKRKGDNDE